MRSLFKCIGPGVFAFLLLAQDCFGLSEIKRQLYEDCERASSLAKQLNDVARSELSRDLIALLRVPIVEISALSPPIAVNWPSSPQGPLSGQAREVAVFNPARETQARICAIRLLRESVPQSLGSLPSLIDISRDPASPKLLAETAWIAAVKIAAHVNSRDSEVADKNASTGPDLAAEVLPAVLEKLVEDDDDIATLVLLEFRDQAPRLIMTRLAEMAEGEISDQASGGLIWKSDSLPEILTLLRLCERLDVPADHAISSAKALFSKLSAKQMSELASGIPAAYINGELFNLIIDSAMLAQLPEQAFQAALKILQRKLNSIDINLLDQHRQFLSREVLQDAERSTKSVADILSSVIIRDKDLFQIATSLVKSKRPAHRFAAVKMYSALGRRSYPIRAAIFPVLQSLLFEPDRSLQLSAAKALLDMEGASTRVVNALVRFLRSYDRAGMDDLRFRVYEDVLSYVETFESANAAQQLAPFALRYLAEADLVAVSSSGEDPPERSMKCDWLDLKPAGIIGEVFSSGTCAAVRLLLRLPWSAVKDLPKIVSSPQNRDSVSRQALLAWLLPRYANLDRAGESAMEELLGADSKHVRLTIFRELVEMRKIPDSMLARLLKSDGLPPSKILAAALLLLGRADLAPMQAQEIAEILRSGVVSGDFSCDEKLEILFGLRSGFKSSFETSSRGNKLIGAAFAETATNIARCAAGLADQLVSRREFHEFLRSLKSLGAINDFVSGIDQSNPKLAVPILDWMLGEPDLAVQARDWLSQIISASGESDLEQAFFLALRLHPLEDRIAIELFNKFEQLKATPHLHLRARALVSLSGAGSQIERVSQLLSDDVRAVLGSSYSESEISPYFAELQRIRNKQLVSVAADVAIKAYDSEELKTRAIRALGFLKDSRKEVLDVLIAAGQSGELELNFEALMAWARIADVDQRSIFFESWDFWLERLRTLLVSPVFPKFLQDRGNLPVMAGMLRSVRLSPGGYNELARAKLLRKYIF